jgi:hypothetical protein
MTYGLQRTKLSPCFPFPIPENRDVREAIARFRVVFGWKSPLVAARNSLTTTIREFFEFPGLESSLVTTDASDS